DVPHLADPALAADPVAIPGAVAVLTAPPMADAHAPQYYGPPRARPASMTLLYIWLLLFAFVGTHLACTLRPSFGSPGQPFELIRHLQGTFYEDIVRTIGNLCS